MSLRGRVLTFALRHLAKPRLRRTADPAQARRDFAVAARLLLPPARGVSSAPVAGPVPMVRVSAAASPQIDGHGSGTGSQGAILYLHGGGFIAGSPETHRALIAALARESGLAVFAPDYRLAPEHPFPAAWNDAEAAFRTLLDAGLAPDRIVLGGDSAGGNLALSLLSRLCIAGTAPAGAFAFSPFTDLTASGASWRDNAESDAFLPRDRLGDLLGFVLAGHDPADPRASPLCATFPLCPPVLMFASDDELLRDDAVALAARLGTATARVELRRGLFHAWPVAADILPEAVQDIRAAARFARDCLSVRPAGSGDS